MNLEEATYAKRIHHQWQPERLEIEFSITDDQKNYLQNVGYNTNA